MGPGEAARGRRTTGGASEGWAGAVRVVAAAATSDCCRSSSGWCNTAKAVSTGSRALAWPRFLTFPGLLVLLAFFMPDLLALLRCAALSCDDSSRPCGLSIIPRNCSNESRSKGSRAPTASEAAWRREEARGAV